MMLICRSATVFGNIKATREFTHLEIIMNHFISMVISIFYYLHVSSSSLLQLLLSFSPFLSQQNSVYPSDNYLCFYGEFLLRIIQRQRCLLI